MLMGVEYSKQLMTRSILQRVQEINLMTLNYMLRKWLK